MRYELFKSTKVILGQGSNSDSTVSSVIYILFVRQCLPHIETSPAPPRKVLRGPHGGSETCILAGKWVIRN